MAMSFGGLVSKSGPKILFNYVADNQQYSLVGSTPIISTYLNKLKTGDYVSIDGSKNDLEKTLIVNSINYIGLKDLLGFWMSDDNSLCFNFVDFTEFSVYQQSSEKKCLISTKKSYTYFVSPTTNSWALLFGNEQISYVGDLKVGSPRSIQITLYDSLSGNALRYLHLRR